MANESDAVTIDGQLVAAVKAGDVAQTRAILDAHPEKLHFRSEPYAWTLLHTAAFAGQLDTVNELLVRGLDVNARERGDNTCAMHWAAAAGELDVVRRLADAGGDVVGHGDDHGLEVIGWATAWDGCDDEAHRAVADFLLGRGARHNIFSAVGVDSADDVRRIVAAAPSQLEATMSHNENFQHPLHFALRMNRVKMVALLLELGADPRATDGEGMGMSAYAAGPKVEHASIELLARHGVRDLFTMLALGDLAAAEALLGPSGRIDPGRDHGMLHLLAKRGDAPGVKWMLDHGANPNERWNHWNGIVTPLHLAAWQGHVDVMKELLAAGADPSIRDSMYDGTALGWAEHGGHLNAVELLRDSTRTKS